MTLFNLFLRPGLQIQIVGNFEQSGPGFVCHTASGQVAAHAGRLVKLIR
jgi:hypothetical protein